jgi:DNA (cytosine-5)-methyltransferase 1
VSRPRLVDLFCGAGGAAVGYHRAGFDVVGVDIRPQPRYPFEFHQADATAVRLHPFESSAGGWAEIDAAQPGNVLAPVDTKIVGFDAIHASPPCQRYSHITRTRHRASVSEHPDLVDRVRTMLAGVGVPWVIENVPGAPLSGVLLCGSMFGIGVRRHRLFESSVGMLAPECAHARQGFAVPVYGHTGAGANRGRERGYGRTNTIEDWREAMGIDWMTVAEITEAIPPAFTEWIGAHLLRAVRARSAP